MTPADELNNAPFDPTAVAAETTNFGTMYTIKVKSWPPESPEPGQNLDAAAWNPDSLCAPSLKGWWREVFGPSKAELRQQLADMTVSRDRVSRVAANYLSENWELRKQVTALQKQCVVHEKMHDDMAAKLKRAELELSATEITVLNLREQVAKTAKRKPGRPKKGISGR